MASLLCCLFSLDQGPLGGLWLAPWGSHACIAASAEGRPGTLLLLAVSSVWDLKYLMVCGVHGHVANETLGENVL